MMVLVACEESQEVCKAFRAKGHEAYSCDIEKCSGGHPEWHIHGKVEPVLHGHCNLLLENGALEPMWRGWDLVIAFPLCTHLAVSGARHFPEKRKDGRQQSAIEFFMMFAGYPGPIAIENPVGIMSTLWRKPDQIIHPYHFGSPEQKKTRIWLNGLPKLTHTDVVEPEYKLYRSKKSKSGFSKWGKITGFNSSTYNPEGAKIRSKTYPGVAKAMADQWG